jgi:hypothetical protein
MPAFEVIVIETATKKDVEDNGAAPEKLILGPVVVLAKDAPTAGHKAMMENADKIKVANLDRTSTLIRPFAEAGE